MASSAGGLVAVPEVGDETMITFAQPCESFDGGNQRGLGGLQAIGLVVMCCSIVAQREPASSPTW